MLIPNNLFPVANLHKQADKVLKFFNKMQREGMMVSAHSEYYVCARGTGKSEGLDARKLLQCVWAMPGSTGGLISPSYAKAWENTLPAICKALKEWGYIQNVHYYVGRKAPASAGFKRPLREPLKDGWGNCLHFWNGTILVVLSFANGMSANSMSLDWVIGPEAKFLNYDKIKSEINPANRGNIKDFGYCQWHHSQLYTTDMPTSKNGRWILEKDKEMDRDHINLIKSIYRELKRYEAMPDQNSYVQRQIKELRRDINLARKFQKPVVEQPGKNREYTVFYGEYDIFDNLEVIGEDFIWQMKRDNPPLIFRTAFLNERLFRNANCFYSGLDDDIHFYIPNDPTGASFKTFKMGDKYNASCLTDYDLDMGSALHIAFDANSAISSACVAQLQDHSLKTLKSFFVKTPYKLQDLVDSISKYYVFKQNTNKDIVFYFDQTFTWTTGTSSESYKDTIIRYFEKAGWKVTAIYIGLQPKHSWKHQQIDMAMKGDPSLLFPVFNLYNNEFLKIAMEQTGVKPGKDGFEKDKSPEKTPDSPDNPDEYKTHITDAWDTLFVGTNFFFNGVGGSFGGVDFLS